MEPSNGNISERVVNGQLPVKCTQMVSRRHNCVESPDDLLELWLWQILVCTGGHLIVTTFQCSRLHVDKLILKERPSDSLELK